MEIMLIDFGHLCVYRFVVLAGLSLAFLPLHCLSTVVYKARCSILMWSSFSVALSFLLPCSLF